MLKRRSKIQSAKKTTIKSNFKRLFSLCDPTPPANANGLLCRTLKSSQQTSHRSIHSGSCLLFIRATRHNTKSWLASLTKKLRLWEKKKRKHDFNAPHHYSRIKLFVSVQNGSCNPHAFSLVSFSNNVSQCCTIQRTDERTIFKSIITSHNSSNNFTNTVSNT